MSLKSNSFVAVAEKYVFSLFLNSDEADVTSLGRPFHTFAPTTVFLYTGVYNSWKYWKSPETWLMLLEKFYN